MCKSPAGTTPRTTTVAIEEPVRSPHAATAARIRADVESHGVLALNLMGSPGAGKTALLEAMARAWGPRVPIVALAGDLETRRDADRLAAAGIPSWAITTGSACHLDAAMIDEGLHHVPWTQARLLVIENVGNLVCPALHDLGQALNVIALSVTEGEDKPLKYPVMFRVADVVVITKTDLLPHLDVRMDQLRDALARVMPAPEVFEVSAKTGDGLDAWIAWLLNRMLPEHPTTSCSPPGH